MKYGLSWFKENYDPAWLRDPLMQKMVLGVEKSRYVDGYVFVVSVLGPISPECISGGVQALTMMYERLGLVFDATGCGGTVRDGSSASAVLST